MASESVDVMTELPTEISRNALKEIIENNPRFAGKEVIVEYDKASGKGDNYSGDLFRIKIRHNSDTWSIVAKFPSFMKTKNEENRPMFHREDLFYQDIYPIFKKFQEERGIFGTAGFYEVPSCVKSGMIEYNEFIFLEDLKVTGFEMYDRFKNVTVDYANETMKILGKLHALSFAIKDQDGNLLKPYTSIQDVLTRGKMTTSLNVWYKILTQKAMDALVDFDEPEVVQKVQKLLETPFKELFENAVEGFTEYPVFCHGDCWNNNVMYRTEVK